MKTAWPPVPVSLYCFRWKRIESAQNALLQYFQPVETRILLVDDDPACRDYLTSQLDKLGYSVLAEAQNIEKAHELIRKYSPELVFLDVEMPGGSGFDLLAQLGSWPFEIIFTTAFSRYAIQALRFSALDYLLKPVQPDELNAALDRFNSEQHTIHDREAIQRQAVSNLKQVDEMGLKLTLTSGDRSYFVAPSEISHCSADGNYTELHLTDGRRFISARTLKEYEEMLTPWGFLRVHRSALVNRTSVSHVEERHLVLTNHVRIEMSRRKRQETIRLLAI